MSLPNHFDLLATDGPARTGKLTTPHGVVRTPAFMPVGTAGAMKGMHWREVRDAGTDIVLGNTYHLMLRPGAERIAALGGLQTFTGWNGPMLTDSGGFQVMSLAQLRKVSESAVTFRSHIDGASLELSPERAIEVQHLLGSDIAMQLDECVRLPAERGDIERAMQLSLRWGERSKRAFETAPPGHMLFGIAQGGDVAELRSARHADDPRPLDEESLWPSARTCARAYLHHLVKSGETLGAMLLSEINIAYYQHLMHDIREAISQGSFSEFRERTRAGWARGD